MAEKESVLAWKRADAAVEPLLVEIEDWEDSNKRASREVPGA